MDDRHKQDWQHQKTRERLGESHLNLSGRRILQYISAMARANLGHQMQYSARVLEQELVADGTPRVLQLQTSGGDYVPKDWRLYANRVLVASGSGYHARQCFEKNSRAFLSVLRKAVNASSDPLTDDPYGLLAIARDVSAVECSTL